LAVGALLAIVQNPQCGFSAVRASLNSCKCWSATGLCERLGHGLKIGVACATFIGSVNAALAACKPSHFRAPYFIRTMGPCHFDIESLSFRGTPVQQAMCLMRGMDATRNLVPTLQNPPTALANRIGETAGLPSREALGGYLSSQDLEWDFAANLWQPIAHARDNDPDAPAAKYFVIHDTSGPYYGHRAFPDDINVNPKINNLFGFACNDEWGKAHVVINRLGDMLVDHDFSIPWRETKFEQATEFGGQLKGLFVHIEMIQPRRAGGRGDNRPPDPAFTPAQYDRLALLYTIASVRAGRWLIPAFHAALDGDIRNGHDDPLNFNIDNFADSLERLATKLRQPELAQAAAVINATDAQFANAPRPADGFWISAQWDRPPRTFALPPVVASTGAPPKADDRPDTASPSPDAAIAADDQATQAPNGNTGRAVFDSVVPPAAALPPAKNDAAQKSEPTNIKPKSEAAEKSASPNTKPSSLADKPAPPNAKPKSDTAGKVPPVNAKLAVRDGEPDRKPDTTLAVSCAMRPGEGHVAKSCQADHARSGEHGREPDRAAEHKPAHESHSARQHGEPPPRHVRNSSRRGRA
jgi:hypothetical protein